MAREELVPTHPFFLNSDDVPSLKLILTTLTGPNYHAWSREMYMALLSKNKVCFIEDSTETPIPKKGDWLFQAWQQANTIVLTWLLNTVDPNIRQSVIWINSAKEVWNDLKQRFSRGDSYRLSDLLEEFYSIKQGMQSVDDFYTKLKTLWGEILTLRPIPVCECDVTCNCGALKKVRENIENEYVMRFIKGLNENYEHVKSQMLLMDPLPNINTAFNMAIKQERLLNYASQQAFTSQVLLNHGCMPRTGMPVYAQEQMINDVNGMAKKGGLGKKNMICTFCGKTGHTVDRCFKKHGFPPNFRFKGKANAVGNTSMVNQVGCPPNQSVHYTGSNLEEFTSAAGVHNSVSAGMTKEGVNFFTAGTDSQFVPPGFTAEQYNKLFPTLNDAQIDNSVASTSSLLHAVDVSTANQAMLPNAGTTRASELEGGDVKKIIAQEIGVEPETQKLFCIGKEKEDCDYLQMAGVKDNAKVLLAEDTRDNGTSSKGINEVSEISRGSEAVAEVRAEVDKLAEQVSALQAVVNGGTKIDDKDIVYLTEMLMRELLKLDNIDAAGEGKMQRKMEVRRIQGFVEEIDTLKARNSNPFSDCSNTVSITTEWEKFDSGDRSLTAPTPVPPTKVTQEWEQFD